MPATRSTDPLTSHEAARTVAAHCSAQQQRVLGALYVLTWASDETIADHLPTMNRGSVVKRRSELVALGLVRDTGVFARTRSGCRCQVWSLTEAGVDLVHQLQRPGEWARVGEATKSSVGSGIRKALSRFGEFEATCRSIGEGRWGVWARYVGESEAKVVQLPTLTSVTVVTPSPVHPAGRGRSSFTCSCGRDFADKHALRKHVEITKHSGGAA